MTRSVFRPAALVLAAALLAGCRAAQPSDAGTSSGTAAPAGDSLEMLSPLREDGRYATGTGPDTGSEEMLLWVDYASHTTTYLCSQPNCSHNTDACTARPPQPQSNAVTPYAICYAAPGDRLLLYLSTDTSSVWVADADGSNRHAVIDWTADMISPCLADSEYLYYTSYRMQENGERSPLMLCRVPLEGGEAQPLFEMRYPADGTTQEEVLGAYGRNVVTLYADYREVLAVETPDLPPEASEEEYTAAWAAYNDKLAQCGSPHQVCLRNVDTGETTVLTQWEAAGQDPGWMTRWQNGRLYQLNSDLSTARILTPDGGMTETPVQWPEELAGMSHGSQPEAIIGGQMIVTCYPDDAPGNHRVAVDPETGACAEIDLMRWDPTTGSEEAMRLYGYSSEYVLLCCEQRETTRTEIAEDGTVWEQPGYLSRYGLLRTGDFLASNPAWSELNSGFEFSIFSAVF